MKIPYFLILTACATANVYAETPRQPPILDNSTYSDTIPAASSAQLPTPSYDDPDELNQLKTDISVLKNKVQEQEETLDNLKRTNAELHKKLTENNKSSANASKSSKAGKAPTPDAKASAKSSERAETEKEHYQHGSALLKKGEYAQAISEFQGFLAAHPNSQYADNAQYWMGVALLNKGDKKGAIQAFDRVARNYPKSEKAPEALYKLGTVLLSVKNKSKAKEYFDYVIQNYPGSDGAKSAAKKKAAEKL